MPRRLVKVATVLSGAVVFALSAGSTVGAATQQAQSGCTSLHLSDGVMIKAKARTALPVRAGTMTTKNWAGYAVTTSDITGVTSTFTVPTAGLVLPGFAATWTGIGGFVNGDKSLIQAGVQEQSLPADPLFPVQYFAWYELLPGMEVPLTDCAGSSNCAVRPGDVITVDISETATSSNNWTITVDDGTAGWSWTQSSISYASSQASAEWILEAPMESGLPTLLAGVGTAHFGPDSTYSVNGSSTQLPIGVGSPTPIDMTTPLIDLGLLGIPSGISTADNQSFNVCAYAASCATP